MHSALGSSQVHRQHCKGVHGVRGQEQVLFSGVELVRWGKKGRGLWLKLEARGELRWVQRERGKGPLKEGTASATQST